MALASANTRITITGTRDELKAVLVFLMSLKDECAYRYNLSENTYFESIEVGSQKLSMREMHTESDIDKFLDSSGNICEIEFDGPYGDFDCVLDAHVFETIADIAPRISMTGDIYYCVYAPETVKCSTKDGKLHMLYDASSVFEDDCVEEYMKYVEGILSYEMLSRIFKFSDLDWADYYEILDVWFWQSNIWESSYSDCWEMIMTDLIQSDLKQDELKNAFDQVKKLEIMDYDDYLSKMRAKEQGDENSETIYDPVNHKYIKRGVF